MKVLQFRNAALLILVAWPLAPLADEPACLPGSTESPGTMTPMGFPCSEGADPSSPVAALADGNTGMMGPNWTRTPLGAGGVSGSSREPEVRGTAEGNVADGMEGTVAGSAPPGEDQIIIIER